MLGLNNTSWKLMIIRTCRMTIHVCHYYNPMEISFYKQHAWAGRVCLLGGVNHAQCRTNVRSALCMIDSLQTNATSSCHCVSVLFVKATQHQLIDQRYTCLPVSICSHTQELTPYKLLNMSIISLNFTNLPFLSWSHSCAHLKVVYVYIL